MNHLVDWIKRHQIIAFFAITFVITWGLGFSWVAVLQRNQGLLLPLTFLSACGPGLAGIIISAITNTQPRQGTRKAFWIAFLAGWAISTLICLANLKFNEEFPLSPAVVVIFTISVMPVAFVIASIWSRIPAVRSYLVSLIHLRGMWGWVLLAVVLFPAIYLISFPINNILNGQSITAYQFPAISLSLVGLIVIRFFYQFLFFNATGEETGWRGFALPRLQTRTSPLIAAVVIAFFWVPWHLFGWWAEGQPISTLQYWIVMYIGHTLLSVLIVWICNRAKGSILVAGIAHAATNTVQVFIPVQDILSLYLTLFVVVLILILADQMWKKLPPDHPAVYKATKSENHED